MSKLTHLGADGSARMVDVGGKADTTRIATASGHIALQAGTIALLRDGAIPKGDVLAAARIAGIMAAKRTSELIPLCHPLSLTKVEIALNIQDDGVYIEASVHTTGKTGVEMEALTAVTVSALTVYDMVKSVDRGAVITSVRVIRKSGGKSGDYDAPARGEEAP